MSSEPKLRQTLQTVRLGWSDDLFLGTQYDYVNYGNSVFLSDERLIFGYENRLIPYIHGGVLETSKCTIQLYPVAFKEDFLYSPTYNWRFRAEGNFIPNVGQGFSNTTFVGLSGDTNRTLAYGTKGWNQFKPGSEDAQMGVFLAELREIPTIPRTLKNLRAGVRNHARDYAKDHLNAQFGWVPFLADLRKFVQTTARKDKILAQLARDNGRPVRRSGIVHENTTTSEVITTGSGFPNGLFPPIHELHFLGNWKQTVTSVYKETYKFSARFRYYIPDIGTPEWKERAIRKLYGVQVTPQLAYNLIPWSWAIDWHTNIGDTFANFSPSLAENLTADYAYITEIRNLVTTTLIEFETHSGPKSCSVVIERESKMRLPASSFGFGVTWEDYTPKQVAIMAALGISRS